MQGIILTVTETCYLLSMISERKDFLERRFDKIYRFMDRRDDLVTYHEKLALIHNEISEISHVEEELRSYIAHLALAPRIKDFLDISGFETLDEK